MDRGEWGCNYLQQKITSFASSALFSATHGFVQTVPPLAFVAPKAGLLSRVSMWEHLSNWDLQIWTFVCCHEFVVGMLVRQRGKNNTQAAL